MLGLLVGRRAWIVLVALFVAGYVYWQESASIRGELAARLDLARGHYVVLGAGYPPHWHAEYVRLLRDRYGIEERVVAGWMVDQPLFDYADAYNQISRTAANRKFGHDVFRETMIEASRNWALEASTSNELIHCPQKGPLKAASRGHGSPGMRSLRCGSKTGPSVAAR